MSLSGVTSGPKGWLCRNIHINLQSTQLYYFIHNNYYIPLTDNPHSCTLSLVRLLLFLCINSAICDIPSSPMGFSPKSSTLNEALPVLTKTKH